MKISLLSLLLIGAMPLTTSPQTARADDGTTAGQTAPPSGTTDSGGNGTQAERLERFKVAMAELGLTDAQKAQIRQIRANVTDRKERRQEILNVLTPEQKAKLRELIEERRDGAGTASPPTST